MRSLKKLFILRALTPTSLRPTRDFDRISTLVSPSSSSVKRSTTSSLNPNQASFFTILTNTLVAIYFSISLRNKSNGLFSVFNKPGTLTSITVYITIVGLVYQVILRPIWEPTGMQMIVDELLHSVIPILVMIYWYLYEESSQVSYKQIPKWLIYPFTYLIVILILGSFSNFYPYPFVDVEHLGFKQVLINSIGLIIIFIGMSALFIKIGRVFEN